jgi:glutamate-ammonia-ligase adenylyltransferase
VARKTKKPAQTPPWSDLPEILRGPAQQRWEAYGVAAAGANARQTRDPSLQRCLCRLFAISEFVADLCIRTPQRIEDLLDSGDLLADSWPGVLTGRVREQLAACPDVKCCVLPVVTSRVGRRSKKP